MAENWIKNKETVTEKDVAAQDKAKNIEKKKIKSGWRWVNVLPSLKILVPHKGGKPTEQGQSMIDIMKEKFNIK